MNRAICFAAGAFLSLTGWCSGDPVAANSRVGMGGETYFGSEKTVNYPEVIRAFALPGVITGDQAYAGASMQISQYYASNQN
jgi:hypothetical protein